MNTLDSFCAALRAAGLDYDGPLVADGKLHRFKAAGDKARNSWFILFPGTPTAGAFGCWKRGFTEKWCERKGQLSPAERADVQRRWQEAERERTRTEKERHAQARKTAAWILDHSAPASASHPYLAAKGIQRHDALLQRRDALVLPLRDANGELHSLQFIAPDGTKRFLPGGQTAGCYYVIGNPTEGLCVAEGYATAASIREATGHAVAIAFDAGNLRLVAEALRAKFPDLRMIACGDDDYRTEGNPGMTKATEAARAVGGLLACPDCKRRSENPSLKRPGCPVAPE